MPTTYTLTIREDRTIERRAARAAAKLPDDLTREEAIALVLLFQDTAARALRTAAEAEARLWAVVLEAGGEVELDREQLRLYPDRLTTRVTVTADGGVRLRAVRRVRVRR